MSSKSARGSLLSLTDISVLALRWIRRRIAAAHAGRSGRWRRHSTMAYGSEADIIIARDWSTIRWFRSRPAYEKAVPVAQLGAGGAFGENLSIGRAFVANDPVFPRTRSKSGGSRSHTVRWVSAKWSMAGWCHGDMFAAWALVWQVSVVPLPDGFTAYGSTLPSCVPSSLYTAAVLCHDRSTDARPALGGSRFSRHWYRHAQRCNKFLL